MTLSSSYRINLCLCRLWPVFSGNVAPPTRSRFVAAKTNGPAMGYGLAIGRSLQAVPRTTGVRWVGQTQREIRASSPSFPFRDPRGHTPRRRCVAQQNGNFAIRFSKSRVILNRSIRFENDKMSVCNKFFILENLISRYFWSFGT